MKNILFIAIAVRFLIGEKGWSQDNGSGGNYWTVIEVGLPRSLVRTSKIGELPKTADTSVAVPPMTYNNLPAQSKFSFEPDKIQAANVFPKVKLPKLYRFYAKAGVGNYTMPYAELFVNEIYNKKGSWGAHAKHFSSNGGIKNVGYSGFSDNEVDAFGKFFVDKLEIGGDLAYKRNVVHYYGFNPDSFDLPRDTIRQRFNFIAANAYVSTFKPDSNKINHRENLSYYYFNDVFGANENYISGGTSLNKWMGRDIYGLDFNVQYNSFRPTYNYDSCLTCLEDKKTDSRQENILLVLNPHINSKGKNWVGKAGLKAVMDVYNKASYFYFMPDVEFRYSLFDDILVPYAGADGGIVRNSYRSLAVENPFVMTFNQELRNTIHKVNVYAGIRGTMSSSLSFNARFSFSALKDQLMFVSDTVFSPETKFGVIYDDGKLISLSGQLNWQQSEKIKLLLRGEYFGYQLTNEYKAWGIPDLKITASGVYDLFDKLLFRADIFFVGTRWARSLVAVEGAEKVEDANIWAQKLKPFVDASLGIEYRYTKRISAFLNINNIAAQRYQYWYKYPVQGINLLGGATFSF